MFITNVVVWGCIWASVIQVVILWEERTHYLLYSAWLLVLHDSTWANSLNVCRLMSLWVLSHKWKHTVSQRKQLIPDETWVTAAEWFQKHFWSPLTGDQKGFNSRLKSYLQDSLCVCVALGVFWVCLWCPHDDQLDARNRAARGKMTVNRIKGCWVVCNSATGIYRYINPHVLKLTCTHTQQGIVHLPATPQRGLNWSTLRGTSFLCYSTAAEAQQQLALSDPSHTQTQRVLCCPVCPSLWVMLLGCQFLSETALSISIAPALNTNLQRTPAVTPHLETVHQNLKLGTDC